MWKNNLQIFCALLICNLLWAGMMYFTNLSKYSIIALLGLLPPFVLYYIAKRRAWYFYLSLMVMQFFLQVFVIEYAQDAIINNDGVIIKAEVYEKGEEIIKSRKYIKYKYQINNEEFGSRTKVSDEFYEDIDDSIRIKVSKSKPWLPEFLEPIL